MSQVLSQNEVDALLKGIEGGDMDEDFDMPDIDDSAVIPYDLIPHFPQAGVTGHAGRIMIGQLQGATVLIMQGRTHFYEGHTPQHITLPVRVMHLMGIETLIVTNAAGGINSNFQIVGHRPLLPEL